MSDFPFLIPESDELKRLNTIGNIILRAMENDQEGIKTMNAEQAAEILDRMRGNDENGDIPSDLTADEFADEWNEMREAIAYQRKCDEIKRRKANS